MAITFQGRYDVKADAKGRLLLPSAWRSQLIDSAGAPSETLMATTSTYKGRPFLDVRTKTSWVNLTEKIEKLSRFRPEVQAFRRFYLSAGMELEMDGQSRFLLPRPLRHYGNIQTELWLVGMGETFEIWDAANWDAISTDMSLDFEAVLGELAGQLDGEELP